jgi:SAM-dependent methyltransferase
MYSDCIAMSPPFSEAAERNRAPILGALRRLLPERGRVLEIGSGTGQHAVHFAPAFPRLSWQPTEQREHLEGLNTRIRLEGPPNILPAIELDVTGPWPDYCFEAVYSSNTAHIMAWDMVQAMFAGVSKRIAPGGAFCLYGPFNVNGEFTSASNQVFDRQLRERDAAMGLRDVGALSALAGEHQMRLAERCQLPANNQLLVFRRNERG